MKRKLSILLSIVLILGFAGCGRAADDRDSNGYNSKESRARSDGPENKPDPDTKTAATIEGEPNNDSDVKTTATENSGESEGNMVYNQELLLIQNTSPELLIENTSSHPLESVIWKQEYDINRNISATVDLDSDGVNENIILGMDTPNGTKINMVIGNRGYNLVYLLSQDFGKTDFGSLFDDFGDVLEGYLVQVSFFDLDDDGIKEVLVAIGDGLLNLKAAVFKYDLGNKDNPFINAGEIWGQDRLFISAEKTLDATYGSQGLFNSYRYEDGRLERLQ